MLADTEQERAALEQTKTFTGVSGASASTALNGYPLAQCRGAVTYS
jgi:hypothetical protein